MGEGGECEERETVRKGVECMERECIGGCMKKCIGGCMEKRMENKQNNPNGIRDGYFKSR